MDQDVVIATVMAAARYAKSELTSAKTRRKTAKRVGRPRQAALRELVGSLALIYEKYSGKRFTFDRHRGSNGEYEPITNGHFFVWTVIEPFVKEAGSIHNITATSVAMECARAVEFLRGLRKHTLKQSEKSRKRRT